jgi:N-glycosylase/DNA lyase
MIHNAIFETAKIEKAVIRVCSLIEEDKKSNLHWESYSEAQLWRELVSCILGSRVRFDTARACAQHLNELGLLNKDFILDNPSQAEIKIKNELKKALFPPFKDNIGCRYRFPNSRARQIINSAIEIYANSRTTIKTILKSHNNSKETRKTIIDKCYGIGSKQASLFLRNISYCDNLAILDSHVNRYINLLKLRENYPSYSASRNSYLYDEKILSEYARIKEISLATLDIAIWVVMSLAQQEFGI